MPTSYALRDLSTQESRAFVKALKRAKSEGRSLRWLVPRLLGLYAEHGLEVIEKAVAEARRSSGAASRRRE